MWDTIFRSTLAVGAALALAPGVAAAGTASGTANAVTLRPLSLVRTDDLEFGSLIPSAVAGTATISATTGTRTTGGGVTGASGATPGAASFTAAGLFNAIAFITLPATIVLTRGGGTETMTVTNITTNGPTTRLFPGSATIDIAVGGRLNVGANQVPGGYSGTFALTVFYL